MRLSEIADQYAGHLQFVCVYIREAHPHDGDQVPKNLQEGILIDQPTSVDARAEAAGLMQARYAFGFPVVIDDLDNTTEDKYVAEPNRLYLIDEDGVVRFKTGLGPAYFDIDAFETAIAAHVGQAA